MTIEIRNSVELWLLNHKYWPYRKSTLHCESIENSLKNPDYGPAQNMPCDGSNLLSKKKKKEKKKVK